jgi:AraC-like DNA-binding protein
MGKNFKELLQLRKLQQAAYLLDNSTLSVDRILESIGYENSSYFYRCFRAKYSCSPKEYRKASRSTL